MNCTQCQEKTEVLETRKYKPYPTWTMRQRKCLSCGFTFKTLEMSIEDFQEALTTPTAEPTRDIIEFED